MARYFCRNISLLTFLLLFSPLTEGVLFCSPQKDISGIINNISSRVNTIEAADAVILDDVSGFSDGDTVLVIQMKGVSSQISQTSGFGQEDGYLEGQPGEYGVGYYEFIVIEQVELGPNRITFRNNLSGFDKYDVEGSVQVLKVPSYENARVTDELTCSEWDSVSGTGGVLALIVNKQLELDADIDVSGKGFRGGDSTVIDGTPLVDPNYYYPVASTVAGYKGEGHATHALGSPIDITTLWKGRGALYTGGGGATGEFSGGGGGASFGEGGNGNRQRTTGFIDVGRGGWLVDPADFIDRIVLGGGGGGSGYTDGTGTSGARGGGIVLILADIVVGNDNTIKANGDSIITIADGNGGAGGGGGAGSVVITARSYASSNINIEAKGGNGGHSTEIYGTGGGGGGGLIWINASSVPAEMQVDVSGGAAGRINWPVGLSQGGDGGDGLVRTDLKMLLNGFLFNSIVFSADTTKIDSICFGQVPGGITGTVPVGGDEPYTYRWEKKVDNDLVWTLVPGSGSTKDLVITATETDTVQFRRVVTDSNATPVSDTSKPVTVIVQPLITDNIVGYDTTICNGQNPLLLEQQAGFTLGGGNNIYTYEWIDSTDVQDWQTAPGVATNDNFDPPVLTTTTYYSRIVTSGVCIDTSTRVRIEVLPLISNNTIQQDQFKCYDELFDDLTGSDPLGGDGSYTYEWLSSTDQSTWVPAEGTNDGRDYNPDENSPNFPGDQYYRRIVRSGLEDCCVDTTSIVVQLSSLASITNNNISFVQTICEDSIPDPLIGDPPGGADGNYTYIWEDSTRASTWTLISGADQIDYNPPALSDTTWYRRIVLSSVCDDTSNVVVINVHPSIVNNTVSTLTGLVDTTICFNQVPNILIGDGLSGGDGSYVYEWEYSTDQSTWAPAPGTRNLAGYSPEALTQDTWFRRRVFSGSCEVVSNNIAITVLQLISNNSVAETDPMTCFNTEPAIINGSNPSGGNGTYTYLWQESPDNIIWSDAPGNNTGIDYQPGSLSDITYYRRVVFSGLADCCKDTSNVINIGIYPLPTGSITPALDTICAGTEITVSMSLTGAAPWTVTLNDGTSNLPSFNVPGNDFDFLHSPGFTSDYTLVSVIDNNACEATALVGSRRVVVYEVPDADAGNDDEACGPEYTLGASASVGDGQWSNLTGAISNIVDITNPVTTVTVNNYGTHTFWWKETNWECKDSASVDITFWEEPDPAYAGEDKELAPYQFEFTLEADEPSVSTNTLWTVVESSNIPAAPYFDSPTSANATVVDLAYGDNILQWTIENGACITSDQVKIYIPLVFIPEGFSPNGDDPNQYFEIQGVENTTNELVITNLAGAVVYRKTNYKNDWEGTNFDGEPLPEGTYYYFLTIRTPVSERFSGYVIIKR